MASQTALIKSKNVNFDITASQLTPNNNLVLVDFSKNKPYPHLQNVVDFLKGSSIAYALKIALPSSKITLQQFWYTAEKRQITTKQGNKVTAISFQTQHGVATITATALRTVLRFPSKGDGFEDLTTDEEVIRFLDLK
ncbi:hypothetical protein L6452_27792 [Arctium lappa]|uniref:Uncharacterized protein n=1 Tax=Arctium lappa TaxID=4217 RepID=A0ACB8ZXA5_ARCLA|nr:hypothetical protein L6452_27792 [Arctium lappa]